MGEENPRTIIIDYPNDFPISGPLREVFTERLKTFFTGRDTWSCSSEGSLPDKLLNLRLKMQKNIGYPPSEPAPELGVPLDAREKKIVLPEELLSWEGLQAKSMEELSPIVRNAGLEMASHILGLQIRYGRPDECFQVATSIHNESDPSGSHVEWWPAQLCPVSLPGRIGVLAKNWSIEDREKLIHVIKRHVGSAAFVAFIIGLVLGLVIGSPNDGPSTSQEAGYGTGHISYTQPVPAVLAPRIHAAPPVPVASIPQPSRSALVAQTAKGEPSVP